MFLFKTEKVPERVAESLQKKFCRVIVTLLYDMNCLMIRERVRTFDFI